MIPNPTFTTASQHGFPEWVWCTPPLDWIWSSFPLWFPILLPNVASLYCSLLLLQAKVPKWSSQTQVIEQNPTPPCVTCSMAAATKRICDRRRHFLWWVAVSVPSVSRHSAWTDFVEYLLWRFAAGSTFCWFYRDGIRWWYELFQVFPRSSRHGQHQH